MNSFAMRSQHARNLQNAGFIYYSLLAKAITSMT